MNIFIYALLDLDNNPFYVGKTNNIKKRQHGHLNMARRGFVSPVYSKIRKLQRQGWLFNFQILEYCTELNCDERERFHIAHLKAQGFKLTNLAEGGEGGCSSESARKGVETRRKNGTLAHTDESKQKLSKAHKGILKTEEHKASLRKAWKRTPEQLKQQGQKSSVTSKGRINIKQYRCVDPNGTEHITSEGLTKFCEEHGLLRANMIKVANGERSNHKGWKCERFPQNDLG